MNGDSSRAGKCFASEMHSEVGFFICAGIFVSPGAAARDVLIEMILFRMNSYA